MGRRTTLRDQLPVVLTIDVEPDNAWENHLNPSVTNVRELLRLQELLDRYGAKATFLVTYRVSQDDGAVGVLRRLRDRNGAEIGAHLHPWETPPFLESGLDVRYPTFPHELPLAAFEQKMARLTEALTRRIGRPTSYRAGRWGLAAEHLPILERLGYEADTSVTPLEDWRSTVGIPRQMGGQGGVDHRRAPWAPYRPSYEDAARCGSADIVEIPVTVGFTRRVPEFVRRRYLRLPILLRQALGKLGILRPVWAAPSEERPRRLERMLRVASAERRAVLNIAFHSSELMVNGSPRTRTKAQVDAVFQRIDDALAVLASTGVCQFRTLTEAVLAWKTNVTKDDRRPPNTARVRLGRASGGSLASSPETNRPLRLVYILAASHSGSTLLALLLGSHPETCTIGELKATSLGDLDTYPCSCGTRIRQCEFWHEVAERMAARGIQFEITRAGTDLQTRAAWWTRPLLRSLHRGPVLESLRDVLLNWSPSWRAALADVQRRNRLLAETVCRLYGAKIIVDSSKIGLRLKYLLRDPELDVSVVRLIRDGRAVALTYVNPREYASTRNPRFLRRGNAHPLEFPRSIRAAAREWRRSNEEADCVLKGLDESRWIQVRYEDLCADPDGTLERLFRFLGVDPAARSLDFRSRSRHVIGNGMRLDSTAQIVLDERWRSVLTAADLREFEAVAGAMNRRYGYV